MSKARKETEDAATGATWPSEVKGTPEPKGTRYVCVSAHDEPRGPGCHIKRLVGEVDEFEKNPGPCWRPESAINSNKEVTESGTVN